MMILHSVHYFGMTKMQWPIVSFVAKNMHAWKCCMLFLKMCIITLKVDIVHMGFDKLLYLMEMDS